MWADDATVAVLQVAASHGLSVTDPRVLRVGENAVIALPAAGALARVTRDQRDLPGVRDQVRIARWLLSQGVDVVRPLPIEPTHVNGLVVSLWEYLADAMSADPVMLAGALRRLHSIPRPAGALLRRVDPFERFDARLAAAAPPFSDADATLLTALRDDLAVQWRAASFELDDAVLHGDAHMDNLLVTPDGRTTFIDPETVCVGPPEWDLTLTALYYEIGWFTQRQYADFAGEYGYDVRTSPTWPMLRLIRMLRMTMWLAQTAADYPDRATQLRHRLQTLRDGTAPTGWTGF